MKTFLTDVCSNDLQRGAQGLALPYAVLCLDFRRDVPVIPVSVLAWFNEGVPRLLTDSGANPL